MSLNKPQFMMKFTGILFFILIISIGLFYQTIFQSNSQAVSLEGSSYLAGSQALRISESMNPFQIEIRSHGSFSQNCKNIQVLLTVDSEVRDLYFEWGLVQNMEIVTSESQLPEHISLIELQTEPLEYDVRICLTERPAHLILQAYILTDDGERVGETAEFYVAAVESQGFGISSDALPRFKIDPKKTKIIR